MSVFIGTDVRVRLCVRVVCVDFREMWVLNNLFNDCYISGGRYIPTPNGLLIANITDEDNGEYLCRAEIPSTGRYEEHRITVEVQGNARGKIDVRGEIEYN